MTDGCCVPESDMVIARDMNMDVPFKGGNQYARICPDCGSRTFTSKSYFKSVDDPYIIPKGESEPIPKAEYEARDEDETEAEPEPEPEPDEAEDEPDEEDGEDDVPTYDCPFGCGGTVEEYEEECPNCGEEIEWVED